MVFQSVYQYHNCWIYFHWSNHDKHLSLSAYLKCTIFPCSLPICDHFFSPSKLFMLLMFLKKKIILICWKFMIACWSLVWRLHTLNCRNILYEWSQHPVIQLYVNVDQMCIFLLFENISILYMLCMHVYLRLSMSHFINDIHISFGALIHPVHWFF